MGGGGVAVMQLSSKLDLQDTRPVVYHALSARMPSHFSLRTFSSAALTQGDVTDLALVQRALALTPAC